MYYFGYRFYDPNLQRWLNRDPIVETGFELLRATKQSVSNEDLNLYLFDRNDSVNRIDPLGLKCVTPFAYGNWCGYFRTGHGGPPIDDVDAACKNHDYCLATPAMFFNPLRQIGCNAKFCAEVAVADCSKAPNPWECRQAKIMLLSACRGALKIVIPWAP